MFFISKCSHGGKTMPKQKKCSIVPKVDDFRHCLTTFFFGTIVLPRSHLLATCEKSCPNQNQNCKGFEILRHTRIFTHSYRIFAIALYIFFKKS